MANMVMSKARKARLVVGGFCPMKSIRIPPWRWPLVSSEPRGRLMKRCISMHMKFGRSIEMTWDGWARRTIGRASDFGVRDA
jgi:hypothetical protein